MAAQRKHLTREQKKKILELIKTHSYEEIGLIVGSTKYYIGEFIRSKGIKLRRDLLDEEIPWDKITPFLGEIPDIQISDDFDVPIGRIRAKREDLGIPSWKKPEASYHTDWYAKKEYEKHCKTTDLMLKWGRSEEIGKLIEEIRCAR